MELEATFLVLQLPVKKCPAVFSSFIIHLYRQGLTEVSVLHDLLMIVKQKPPQYMVLDPVQADAPEPKAYIQFLSLKKVCWSLPSFTFK